MKIQVDEVNSVQRKILVELPPEALLALGGLYADLHYVNLATDDSGSVSMGRLSIGVEQSVGPAWVVRGGATADTIQQWSLGGGVSYGGIKGSTIDFGYQYNAAPEMEPELGRVHLLSISAAWAL